MNPLITVIIPLYNNAKYLPRCIDSILKQTYTNFELIIVNDGSTDGSELICRKFAAKDSRVKLFEQDNLGVSVARNVGMKNARGEWITFCDSDDWVDDLWLETFVQHISLEDELLIQGFKSIGWPTGETEIGVRSEFSTKEDLLVLMNEVHVVGYTWCKLFKKEIIDKNNLLFEPGIRSMQDEIFVLKYFTKITSVKNIPFGFYNYVYPDYHCKYVKKRNPEIAYLLSRYAREIFGNNNYTHPLIIRYYALSIGFLFSTYKVTKSGTKEAMKKFLDFYYDYIPFIHIDSPKGFRPLRFIFHRDNPLLSHYLFFIYCTVLRIIHK